MMCAGKIRVKEGKIRHSCSSIEFRWCQMGMICTSAWEKQILSRDAKEGMSDFFRYWLRDLPKWKKESEEDNANHPPALERFTGLVRRLAMKVLPDSSSACFAHAECINSPKVQQSSLRDAQEKEITDFSMCDHYNDVKGHLSTVTMSDTLSHATNEDRVTQIFELCSFLGFKITF